ncbi:MAG: hypothetical protein QW393_05025 [Candidatus Micrarchaeaceae archaeon]
MTTITSNKVTTYVSASSPPPSSCPSTGQYIFWNGTQYPYTYSSQNPYTEQVAFPSSGFCVYYQGGDITTGCYCVGGSPLFVRGSMSLIYTDGNGHYWGLITLSDSSTGYTYQFGADF